MNKWLCLCLSLTCISLARADDFPVVIGDTAYNNMPGLAEKVVTALKAEGLNAKLKVVPGDRALHLLQNGSAALDIIRHPKVVYGQQQLLQISQPIKSIRLARIVSSNSPQNCTEPSSNLSVAGIRGIRAFDGVIAPTFKNIIWVPSVENAFRMVAARRADSTYWMINRLHLIPTQLSASLVTCDKNNVSIPLHSYLHSSYEWALPKVEAAYVKLLEKK